LKLRSFGRSFALVASAAVVFAACSNNGASPSTGAASSGPTSAASAGGSAGTGSMKVGYLPKDIAQSVLRRGQDRGRQGGR